MMLRALAFFFLVGVIYGLLAADPIAWSVSLLGLGIAGVALAAR